jgi:multidrug efflux pump
MKSLNLSEWAVRHQALVLFLIIAVAVSGVFAYFQMGRAEDPSFTIKTMTVTAAWPGATADEMQRLVTDRIEAKLQEMPHFKYVQSFTRPGSSATLLNLKDSVPPKELREIWLQARKKVADIRHTLPPGVIGPFFNDEFGDVFAAIYMLTGEGVSNAELVRQAELLRQDLLRVPNVEKVEIFGEQDQKIFVEFSHAKLATLGIPPQTLFDSLTRQNAVTPAGSIDTGSDRVYLRIDGALAGEDAVAAVPVAANGKVFRLGDIATVRRGYDEPAKYLVHHDGKPAVALAVSMTKKANGLQLGNDLHQAEEAIVARLPIGLEIHQVHDQPHLIASSVNEFLSKFAAALVVVIVVSFASLGFRTGIVVALSVPLTLAATFVVMDMAGMEFERITLGALIISLGLLVDDAIIAIEMMVVKLEQGWDRMKAATFAWTSTAFPMLTGTLLTVAGFIPVGFAKSSSGEYAGGIFWVVGIALIISWFVAVVFTPYLGVRLLPDFAARRAAAGTGHGAGHGASHDDVYHGPFYSRLRQAVRWAVEHRRTVVLATLTLFLLAGAGMAFVSKQFFPTSARPELLIELRLREGASTQATQAAAAKVEAILKDDPEIRWFNTYIGAGSPRFFLSLDPALNNENFALIVVMTHDTAARDRLRLRLKATMHDELVPEARVRVRRLDFGPPVPFQVQFRVFAQDPAQARETAGQLLAAVRANPNTVDAHLNWGERVDRVRVEIDQDRARLLGLTPSDLSQSLQTLLSGVSVTQVRDGTELVDVVARAVPAERLDLESLQDLTVTTRSGALVPLSQVARLVYDTEKPITWRRNREHLVLVNADIVDGVQGPDVTKAIMPALTELQASLPAGVRVEVGGATEESAKANKALFAVFPVMILIMLTLLMMQLQNFSKVLLVFLTAPLGLIGAVVALLLTGAPFGFVALLGLIAMAGMIMRNTLILVDQIDVDVAAGSNLTQAIIESTVRRARPVVLTALAAILAFVPLSLSVFWGPMAVTMIGGLTVATILTLLFLPALYALWFRAPRDGSAASDEVSEPPSSRSMPGTLAVRMAAE